MVPKGPQPENPPGKINVSRFIIVTHVYQSTQQCIICQMAGYKKQDTKNRTTKLEAEMAQKIKEA
jgi:hypothetical protein